MFLGANAIADVVAANYNTTKEQLLTDNNKSMYLNMFLVVVLIVQLLLFADWTAFLCLQVQLAKLKLSHVLAFAGHQLINFECDLPYVVMYVPMLSQIYLLFYIIFNNVK